MSMDLGSFIGTEKAPSAPGLKFETVGTYHDLEITAVDQMQCSDFDTGELEFWPDGNKKMQLAITGKVDESYREDEDDALLRRFYAPKPSNKLRAIAEGVLAAGEKEPKIGGKMRIKYTGDGELPAGKKRGIPPKLYAVQYKAPNATADFLGTGAGGSSGGGLRAPAGKAPKSDDEPPF